MILRCWLLALLALGMAGPALAHESLPLVISLSERAPDTFVVHVREPPALADRASATVHLPGTCVAAGQSSLMRCEAGIDGKPLSWSFSGPVPAVPALVRIDRLSGEVRTQVASPGETQVTIPHAESVGGVSRQYLALGFEHIFTGYDHLLFLACLLWIAGGLRRTILTVTGFTLGHSLTLALSALSVIHVPRPPIEAAIALSVLFLAREIAVGKRDSLVWHYPVAVSTLLGLLHGIGFASVLTETGLPQTQLPAALLFFNLGVEAGQIALVIAVLAIVLLVKTYHSRIRAALPAIHAGFAKHASALTLTFIGAVSAFWFIERSVALFG